MSIYVLYKTISPCLCEEARAISFLQTFLPYIIYAQVQHLSLFFQYELWTRRTFLIPVLMVSTFIFWTSPPESFLRIHI